MRITRRALPLVSLVLAAVVVQSTSAGVAKNSSLVVPDQYPNIQAAVNAASSGASIVVRAGTYAEQVTITKTVSIKGAGASATTIKAPSVLVPDSFGRTAIVKIDSGARVDLSDLTISGPAATACADGTLNAGIWVTGDATLNMRSAQVLHIHDTPRQFCNRAGTAISVGNFVLGETGHANVDDVLIADYQGNGVGVFEPGSTVTITHSTIDAQTTAADAGVFTGGVEVGDGAVADIEHDTIANARCVGSNDLGPCGGDPMTTFQAAGISSGPGLPPGPGTEFAHNVVSGNDVGIYLAFADGCCSVHHNKIVDNIFFGVVIQDSTNDESHDQISGGPVGVAVVADAVDSVGTLHHDQITGQSVAPTQELQCCGFTANVIRSP